MKDITLTQGFALLALNAQASDRMTVARRAALRCIAAASLLEAALDHALPLDAAPALPDSALSLYQQIALSEMHVRDADAPLSKCIAVAAHLRDRQLKKIERAVTESLMGEGLLESIPSLISCDLYIHEAGVEYTEYRADQSAYLGIAERLRAEVLENGTLTDDCVAMLWLLRESGALTDLFAEEELTAVGARTLEAYRTNPFARTLYLIKIHSFVEHSIKGMLRAKSKLLATDAGLGINFLCPLLERSQSIFIEAEGIGAKAEGRMESIRERLSLLGHRWEILHEGRVPLVRIDNVVYECIPDGTTLAGGSFCVPIYGVRLRRYPVFL